MLQAAADEKVYAVEAAGKRGLYEAENVLSDAQIELRRALATIAALPEVIKQSVKPLENIEGIKILQGYGATGNLTSSMSAQTGQVGIAEQITNAALNYRANAPVVDAMLRYVNLA